MKITHKHARRAYELSTKSVPANARASHSLTQPHTYRQTNTVNQLELDIPNKNLSEQDNSWTSISYYNLCWFLFFLSFDWKSEQMCKHVSQYRINTWHFVASDFTNKNKHIEKFIDAEKLCTRHSESCDGRARCGTYVNYHDQKTIQAANYMSKLFWVSYFMHRYNRRRMKRKLCIALRMMRQSYPFLHINTRMCSMDTNRHTSSAKAKRILCFWLSCPLPFIHNFVIVLHTHTHSHFVKSTKRSPIEPS